MNLSMIVRLLTFGIVVANLVVSVRDNKRHKATVASLENTIAEQRAEIASLKSSKVSGEWTSTLN